MGQFDGSESVAGVLHGVGAIFQLDVGVGSIFLRGRAGRRGVSVRDALLLLRFTSSKAPGTQLDAFRIFGESFLLAPDRDIELENPLVVFDPLPVRSFTQLVRWSRLYLISARSKNI